jgi:hypothetical protein
MPRSIRPIRIEGNLAYVPLTQGHEAVIDAADVPLVARWNWCAKRQRNVIYAKRKATLLNGTREVRMHRVIMGEPLGLEVDHIDGDGLNNRRSNLRAVTGQQNSRNARVRRDNTTGFKGVSCIKPDQKWRATINVDGKRVWLGCFNTPESAHAAYCAASKKYHGDFGRIS